MYNEDLNNINANSENELQTTSEQNMNEVYQPEVSYDYPTYSEGEASEEESNKKGPVFIIIVLVILVLLGILGFFGYKYFFSGDKEVNIDNITVEGGNLNPEFTDEVLEYNVESINDSVKLMCFYKRKKVITEGCNKSILLTDKTSTSIQVKTKDKIYVFNIVKISEDSPIINNVTGNDSKDWTKSVKLTIDAIFKNEQHSEAYSFDGGKTWQKENSKEIKTNGEVQIVVRDIKENLSSVYTEKIEKVDSTLPTVDISVSNKQAIITIKDSDSGITNLVVTNSSKQPSEIKKVDLTKETIVKYTAVNDGDFYVWVKDKAGNVASKKFTIGSPTTSENNNDANNSNNSNNNNNNNNNNSNNNNNNNSNNTNNTDNNASIAEKINISKDLGNATNWTDKVTLKVNATSNKNGILEYSFDGGKTFNTDNSKTFTSNQTVTIVVKNRTTGKTASVTEKIQYIDNTKPSCSKVVGASTEWSNLDRTISVTCSDNGSGCRNTTVSKTFNKTTKTSTITIYDKVGNKTDCPVNVYVDKTAPTVTYEYKDFVNTLGKVYKFQLFLTDNEAGLNLGEIKYKQRVLKNGVDNLWLNKFDGSKEISASNGIYYSYRLTKEIGIYNYFTISVPDNVGNISEIEIAIED